MSAIQVDSKSIAAAPLPMTERNRSLLQGTAMLKSLLAKTSMLPPNATAAQKRQAFESALATRLTNVRTHGKSAMDTKTGADVVADIEKKLEWTELMTEAVRVGLSLNVPFLGLQSALYAAITVRSDIAESVADRLLVCIRSAAKTSKYLTRYIDQQLKITADEASDIVRAFDLLRDLNSDFNQVLLERRHALIDNAEVDEDVANAIADYQRLISLTERCYIQDFGPQSVSQITDIVRQLLATPTKAIYLTMSGRYMDMIEEAAPFLAIRQFAIAIFGQTVFDRFVECTERELKYLSATTGLPKANTTKLDALLRSEIPAENRRIYMLEKIDLQFKHLETAIGLTFTDEGWLRTAIRAVRQRIENCFWPNPIQPIPSAVAVAPVSNANQINANYGAAGIATGNNAQNYASSIGSAYSAVTGRPVIPLDKMVWPPKPTKKGGGRIAFRPTVVRCFF